MPAFAIGTKNLTRLNTRNLRSASVIFIAMLLEFTCRKKAREGCGCPKSLLEGFSGKFRGCWNMIPRSSGRMLSLPRFLGTFRQREWLNGCWKVSPAFVNAPALPPPRPPQPFGVFLILLRLYLLTPTRSCNTHRGSFLYFCFEKILCEKEAVCNELIHN